MSQNTLVLEVAEKELRSPKCTRVWKPSRSTVTLQRTIEGHWVTHTPPGRRNLRALRVVRVSVTPLPRSVRVSRDQNTPIYLYTSRCDNCDNLVFVCRVFQVKFSTTSRLWRVFCRIFWVPKSVEWHRNRFNFEPLFQV